MASSAETVIPEYPLFEVDEPEVVFGAHVSRYFGGPSWDGAKAPSVELSYQLRDEVKAFEKLFFEGGKLADVGRQIKPDLDTATVMRALRALAASWGVSHQQKEATVALAIHHWTEPLSEQSA